jgi:hypothetical protein
MVVQDLSTSDLGDTAPTDYGETVPDNAKGEAASHDNCVRDTQSELSKKAAPSAISIKPPSATSGAYPSTIRWTFLVILIGLIFFLIAMDRTIIAIATQLPYPDVLISVQQSQRILKRYRMPHGMYLHISSHLLHFNQRGAKFTRCLI